MTADRIELARVIRDVTDAWEEPLDEVHDVPQIVNAVLAWQASRPDVPAGASGVDRCSYCGRVDQHVEVGTEDNGVPTAICGDCEQEPQYLTGVPEDWMFDSKDELVEKAFEAGCAWHHYHHHDPSALDIPAAGLRVTREAVTDVEVGRFLSEWLDDNAPLNERRYLHAARALARKYPALGVTVADEVQP
ncbi:hypothetical protein DDP54_15730 (plasmid) [Cellulomonas sp. WB94]|uniref:hypothetical protein n=1 Tax=Cellulomonas sp. WB94 TaxID=2173174 RepID=UPI000D57BC5E|nr:hypothetical protein [Cellulomonas sp. WB94]PVU81350.1 hypothetical protein DDP54_15730 [Cellulomonas sp. WB94]